MRGRAAVMFSLMTILTLLRVEAYTVVMKNGKSMDGSLISETADGIVFRDDKGMQFSLKKSALDLEKMETANRPPPPVAPPSPVETAPAPQQSQTRKATRPAKVYTEDDIARLKGVSTDSLLEPGVEDTGDPYTNAMHSAGVLLADVYGKSQSLAAQMVSVYEIAESAGKDGNEAAEKFASGVTGSTILRAIDADLEKLRSLRDRITPLDPGDRRAKALDTLDQVLKTIPSMRSMLGPPHILSTRDFESRTNEMSNLLNRASMSLQAVEPAGGYPGEKIAPDDDQSEE